MNNSNRNRWLTMPILFLAIFLFAGCSSLPITTCHYDPSLVAVLGKTKVDVQTAYESSRKQDVETARNDVTELVATAERTKTATCTEPSSQAQSIEAIFSKMEFKKAKKAIDQNRLENLLEAIDLALATQEQLKK